MSNTHPDAFMPLWIADYLADTTHLTCEQHGAYFLLLMTYWRRGGHMPADNACLAAITKLSPQKWRTMRVVMEKFFREDGGQWKNKRADAEILKASKLKKDKAAAGKKGAEKRWSGHSSAIDQPSENTEKPIAENGPSPPPVRTRTEVSSPSPLSSPPDNQNLVEPLLVCDERKPLTTVTPLKVISSKRERATRWPADAVIPDEWIAEAAERRRAHGKPVIDLLLEAEKFQNFWSAKSGAGATKLDWRATWRNWTLNAHGAYGNGKGQFGNGRSVSDHPLGIFAQLGDEIRDREIQGDGWTEDHGGSAH